MNAQKAEINKINIPIKTINSLDEFCKSGTVSKTKPKKTSKIRDFIIKFSRDCRKKLLPKIQSYIEEQNKQFYAELRTVSEIIIFEENKLLLKALLQKSPKELNCTDKEYIALIEKIKKNLFDRIDYNEFFNSDIEKGIFSQIKRQFVESKDKLNIKQIYLSQDYYKNLDLAKAQKAFSPREIKIKKPNKTLKMSLKIRLKNFKI